MIFLDLDDLLHVAERTLSAHPAVRHHALLASALARPQAPTSGVAGGDVDDGPSIATELERSTERWR